MKLLIANKRTNKEMTKLYNNLLRKLGSTRLSIGVIKLLLKKGKI